MVASGSIRATLSPNSTVRRKQGKPKGRGMRRRSWGAVIVPAALLLPVATVTGGAQAQVPLLDQAATPNVIVVVTDDQREGLQVMDETRAALEGDGRSFDNAFV